MGAGRRHKKGLCYSKHIKQHEYNICDNLPCSLLAREVDRGAQANVAPALVCVTSEEPKLREPKSFIIGCLLFAPEETFIFIILDSRQTWSLIGKETLTFFPQLFPRNIGFSQSFSCLHCHTFLLSLGHLAVKEMREKILIRISVFYSSFYWVFISQFNCPKQQMFSWGFNFFPH